MLRGGVIVKVLLSSVIKVNMQGSYTSVNISMARSMGKAPISVPMGPNTLVNGNMAGKTDKAPLPISMEECKKAYLKTVSSSLPGRPHPEPLP